MERHDKNSEKNSIELSADMAGGTYSNLTIITHSADEFIFDFCSQLPGMPKPRVQSRVIMTPLRAKQLLRAIEDNVAGYERKFGTIELPANELAIPISGVKGEA